MNRVVRKELSENELSEKGIEVRMNWVRGELSKSEASEKGIK